MEPTFTNGARFGIRDATVSDAEALVELDRAIVTDGRGVVLGLEQLRGAEAYRSRIDDVLRAMSEGAATRSLVAEVGACVVGNAELRQLAPAFCRHVGVLAIGIHPAHQRLGIGRALMTALIDHACACGLERLELYVRADNDRAHELYRSLGFRHECTRARFVRLSDGRYVDDWVFARMIAAKTVC